MTDTTHKYEHFELMTMQNYVYMWKGNNPCIEEFINNYIAHSLPVWKVTPQLTHIGYGRLFTKLKERFPDTEFRYSFQNSTGEICFGTRYDFK